MKKEIMTNETKIGNLLEKFSLKVKQSQETEEHIEEFLSELINHDLIGADELYDVETYASVVTAFNIYAKTSLDEETKKVLKFSCIKTIINAINKKKGKAYTKTQVGNEQ